MIRTRFAPSPTGSLHVGNARIAIFNWLFARRHGGAFVLRIEDTDRERNVPGAEAAMLDDLRWLGLDWDEGPSAGGGDGPYRQSERGALYAEQAASLLASGLAFRCYCTPEELAQQREAALARGEPVRYAGTCRELSRDEAARLEREGRRPAVRFRVPDEGEVAIHDAVRGGIRFAAAEIGDFVLLRSDGEATYNFAVVVDDALMRITHVIRGAGHLSNTPRQALLFDALGIDRPVFAHVPTVLGPDRQKLSKRHGARALADYRREGVDPDGILNYLSLLGWSSPSGEEFLARERLIREISLERIGAADVVFDPAKLAWLSARHIEAMPLPALVEAVSSYLDRERYPLEDETLPVAVAAVRTHLAKFSDINDHLAPFVPTLDAVEQAARAGLLRQDPDALRVLGAVRRALASIESWEEEKLGPAVRAAGEDAGARGRALFEPLRLALTGQAHGPPLAAVLHVLGRAAALRLLDEVLAGGT